MLTDIKKLKSSRIAYGQTDRQTDRQTRTHTLLHADFPDKANFKETKQILKKPGECRPEAGQHTYVCLISSHVPNYCMHLSPVGHLSQHLRMLLEVTITLE